MTDGIPLPPFKLAGYHHKVFPVLQLLLPLSYIFRPEFHRIPRRQELCGCGGVFRQKPGIFPELHSINAIKPNDARMVLKLLRRILHTTLVHSCVAGIFQNLPGIFQNKGIPHRIDLKPTKSSRNQQEYATKYYTTGHKYISERTVSLRCSQCCCWLVDCQPL
jgi:hypothetical protein